MSVPICLSIDTSSPTLVLALHRPNHPLLSFQSETSFSHCEQLFPQIEQLLQTAHLTLSELALISVITGPGSFTGLRIGLSAAKALAYSLGIPCLPLCTLDVWALQAKPNLSANQNLMMLMDARRGRAYAARYTHHLRQGEVYLDNVHELQERHPADYFAGNVDVCSTMIRHSCPADLITLTLESYSGPPTTPDLNQIKPLYVAEFS